MEGWIAYFLVMRRLVYQFAELLGSVGNMMELNHYLHRRLWLIKVWQNQLKSQMSYSCREQKLVILASPTDDFQNQVPMRVATLLLIMAAEFVEKQMATS